MAEGSNEGLKDKQEKTQNAAPSSSASFTSQQDPQMRRQQNPPARRLSGPTMSAMRKKGNGTRNPKRSSPIRSIFNAVVKYLYSDPTFQEALTVDEVCQLYALYKQATGIHLCVNIKYYINI